VSADPVRFSIEIRFILCTHTHIHTHTHIYTQENSALFQISLWFTGYVCFWSQATGAEGEPPLPSSAKMKVRGTVPLKPP